MRGLAAVILAAGKGTRMKSELPKALHAVCGRPMLWFLLEVTKALKPRKTVVIAGHGIELVKKSFARRAAIIRQRELLGSGYAVAQAAGVLSGFDGEVIVLYCDTPLLKPETLARLLETHRREAAACTLLSAELDDAASYGRIVRDRAGRVTGIVEANDATEAEKAIGEINVGCYVFDARKLFEALKKIKRNAAKNEYYLTDVVGILAAEGKVEAVVSNDKEEILGVNSRKDLAGIQEIAQKKILERWMERGVTFRDPKTTVVDADVEIGQDTVIFSHTVIEQGSVIGRGCRIGPFARIRGGSKIADGAVIGNFVEVARSQIGKGSQAKHLSYLGDASLGAGVNVGAGTITANFDGSAKHKTLIKEGAEIGSGTVLIAPVTVGRQAKTGAGAVVTKNKNVPDRGVAVGVPAKNVPSKAKKRK